MSFFYDLNKKLDSIRATPEVTHQQLNERDMSRAAKGYEKYGKQGMEALAKAGREGKALDPVRKKYDKYDNTEVDEGVMDTVKSVGKKVASGINKLVGHGSDEDMRKDVQRKAGAPVTGKKPEQKTTEAAKYRDPKYKDKLYTQEPPDYTYGPDMDDAYDNPKPDDYAGRKRKIGGGEFPSTDPLASGQGIGRSGIKNNILDRGSRKGMPSRDQITSLKGNIKAAKGTHAEPNLPEASGSIDYEKVLEAIAALYGDDMWENDAMGDLAQDLEQAGPTDRELDFIIAKGKLPTRLKGIRFTNTDDVQFGHLDEKSGDPMTAKQKSFAKLAPPADKITFADKIAGAKKEVDEMLGDVAAEAMRSALGGGKGRNAEMDEEKSKGTAFDMSTKRVDKPKVGSIERGHKHDIKHTATGRMVTRRTDAQGNSVGADDDTDTQAGPRGRGRPKGTTGAIGAKGPSGRSKLMTKEGADQGQAQQVVDDLAELRAIAKQSQRGGQFPQGFASQLEVVLYAAMTLIKNQQPGDAQVREEEKTSTRDDHAEKAGKKVTKDIEYDEKKKDGIHGKKRGPEDAKAEKAGKKVAKDIEYDEKKKDKKEEEVDESTTSGSIATSTATKGSKGGVYGKGIYDSMNRELENMIAESMSINMSDSTEGNKSLTVTATDEDAMKLAMMLKSAGVGGHDHDMHSGMAEAVDENSPDYPTNTQQAENNFGYPGGLNKPKTDVAGDGQTTIPNTAVHTQDEDALRRMMEMAGMSQNNRLDEGMMDKIKGMLVPKLMKLLGPDADNIANAVRQATGGDLTPSKENAMKVVQALGIDKAAAQGQSPQMAEGIAGNWQGKLIQSLYTLGLLGSAAVTMWASGPGRGTDLGVASGIITMIGVVLLMFAGAFFGDAPGQTGAMGKFGNQGTSTRKGLDIHGRPTVNYNVKEDDDLSRMMEMAGVKQAELEPWKETMKEEEEDFFHNPNVPADKQLPAPPKEVELDEELEEDFLESIQRMREIAGIKEAKKQVDQNGDGKNDFEDIKIARMKASGAIKDKEEKKVDESIFALNNQWQAYKG